MLRKPLQLFWVTLPSRLTSTPRWSSTFSTYSNFLAHWNAWNISLHASRIYKFLFFNRIPDINEIFKLWDFPLRVSCVCVYLPVLPSPEQLQRGRAERGRPCGRHERGRALRRQGGHLRGPQDVRSQWRLRGLLQRTGSATVTLRLAPRENLSLWRNRFEWQHKHIYWLVIEMRIFSNNNKYHDILNVNVIHFHPVE